MALPTFKEVWSRYLFDSDTVPIGSVMIRTYSNKQGELRYGNGFDAETM